MFSLPGTRVLLQVAEDHEQEFPRAAHVRCHGMVCTSPFRIKSLMQKLWMMKLGWDEIIPQQLSDEWTKWQQELSALTDHSIPRRLFSQDQSRLSIQLHGFSDASLDGYGCVVYIRTVYVDKLF